MAAKAEALAKQFEAKAQEATGVLEALTDGDWAKTTAAEKWPVGVVAHHIAVAHEIIGGLVKTLADGKPGPNLPMDAIHQMNAAHAAEHAKCAKVDTVALHKKNAAAAAALIRGLGDAELGRSGMVLQGLPAMSAEQLVGGLMLGHVDEHLSSIRATVGRAGG